MTDRYSIVNDQLIPADQASLLINDLSIQRGYGVFDFFKALHHTPIFLDDHLTRFFHSAAQLRLPVGRTREELQTLISALLQKNNLPDSGIRLTLTGGYSPDSMSLSQPNLILTQIPLTVPITKECQPPIRLVTYPHQRQLPDTKTIDYLMAIWLQPYIRERGANDVLYHHGGIITESPRSNFFIVTADDTLVTPARNILKGITRMKILELAPPHQKTEERDITLEELQTAKEAFVSSTTKQLLPVTHINNRPIGKGVPGPVTKTLNAQMYSLTILLSS